MKKILVPVDFSLCAIEALKVATVWAEKNEAELVLLYVLENHDFEELIDAQTHTDSKFTLKEDFIQVKEELKGLTAELKVKNSIKIYSGNIKDAILKAVHLENAEMIIMGTRGNNNNKRVFLGSTAESILRESKVPVLSVKYSKITFTPKKVALAIDLEDKLELPIQKIDEIRKKLEAKLHIVYVNTANNFSTNRDLNKKMTNFAKKYELKDYQFHIYCDILQDEGIKNFANDEKIDLIIMFSHQRKGLSKFWKGSVSEGVVGESLVPVLTFPSN